MKIRIALYLLFSFAAPGFAVPPFTLAPATPVIPVAKVHEVAPTSAGFRMFYSVPAIFKPIRSVTSPDGILWTTDAGFRLAPTADTPDDSGIISFGMTPQNLAGYYTAYYVGVSSTGIYSILKATSANQVDWAKTSGFSLPFTGGVDSPHPHVIDSTHTMLYYVRDPAAGVDPANYRAYRRLSADGGATFGSEIGLASGLSAYSLYVSTLTDGKVRVSIVTPLSGGTTMQMLNYASADDGYSFSLESGVSFSTPTLSSFCAIRSTDTYRWRAFMTVDDPAGDPQIYSALTKGPSISSLSPSKAYQDNGAANFTVYGEVFSTTTPRVDLKKGSIPIPITSITRNSDMQLIIVANSSGVPTGNYTLTVTNVDDLGLLATLGGALNVDIRPGTVLLTDNLFRPLGAAPGNTCKINVSAYSPGTLQIKIYTTNGELVRTLYDGPFTPGTVPAQPVVWNGKIDSGRTAASGLYLVKIRAPKLSTTEKVVLIK